MKLPKCKYCEGEIHLEELENTYGGAYAFCCNSCGKQQPNSVFNLLKIYFLTRKRRRENKKSSKQFNSMLRSINEKEIDNYINTTTCSFTSDEGLETTLYLKDWKNLSDHQLLTCFKLPGGINANFSLEDLRNKVRIILVNKNEKQ